MKDCADFLRRTWSFPLALGLAAFVSACGPSASPGAGSGSTGSRYVGAIDTGARDFDIRGIIRTTLAAPVVPMSNARQQLLDTMRVAAPGEFVVRYSEFTDAPSRLTRRGPSLTALSGAAPKQIANDFLKQYRGLYELSDADLANSRFSRDYSTDGNGVHHYTVQFRAGGVDVFGSALTINVDPKGGVINASGEPLPNARDHVNTATPVVSERDAVTIAAQAAHVQAVASWQALGLVYFPLSRTELRLARNVMFTEAGTSHLYRSMVDAADGRLLWRKSLTSYNHIPTHGAVYTSDSPIPNTPQGSSTGTVPRQDSPFTGILEFPHDDQHFDWWAGGARTTTTSNNVDAYTDRDGDDSPDPGSRPTAGAGEDFTFPLDLTMDPSNSRNAAVANLFYWNNRLHDFFYRLGFNEAAGNFQGTNFGLGGSGGDPVNAEAQDNADGTPPSLCNANFSTPGDGSPPRMQMFQCDNTTPARDGDLETIVMGHEYTHGVHSRLVATSGSQAENEGWADYFGLSNVAQASDPYNGSYGVGDYLFGLAGQGIRSFPYSTNTSVFKLTYSSLNTGSSCTVAVCSNDPTTTCSKDSDCGTGNTCGTPCKFQQDCKPPRTTIDQGICQTEVHFAGSIWANPILTARFNLVEKFGFPAGENAMNRLVIDGMKLASDNPTFLDARDKILEADEADFGSADRCLIWSAFAQAGMGFTASTTGVDDINPVERFDVPTYCSPVLQIDAPASFGTACVGASQTLALEVFNTGAGELIVSSIARISGSADIALDGQPTLPVVVGGDSHVDFTVRCTPTASGTATATFRIKSNDSAQPTKDVVYTCNRGSGDMNVAVADSGDFGGVCAADHADLSVTLLNGGACDLSISSITTAPGGGSFKLPTDLQFPLVLASGTDFALPVRYAPLACSATPETASIRLTSNDPGRPVVDVPVKGNAPCGQINVAIADSGAFGEVCQGDQADLNLTLFNQGRCDLRITGISLVPPSGSFSLPANLVFPLILSHDADFNLPVRFAPNACSDAGVTAIVRIFTSDPTRPTVDVPVSGVSPCPNLVIDPTAVTGPVAFPPTVVDAAKNLGCFSEEIVDLRNNGKCPLTIQSISAAGLNNTIDYAVMEPSVFPVTLPPGEETLGVRIRFTPQADTAPLAPTENRGTLTVVSNDPGGAATADLCGEAVAGSGARILVTDVSSGTPVPVSVVDKITIDSKGLSQPGPISLSFTSATLQQSTVCGHVIRYHVDQETLPPVQTTGSNPASSYEAGAKLGSLQTAAQFSLGPCDFPQVQLELRSSGSPACTLVPTGGSCTTDGQCCSGKCRGSTGSMTCN
jgi:hypothetical protein